MDIDPSHGRLPPIDYALDDDGCLGKIGLLPTELHGEVLSYLSVSDHASFAQVRKVLSSAFYLAAVSDVFVQLQNASGQAQVDAALDAIPDISPRERLALLYAMTQRLRATHTPYSGLRMEKLASMIDDAWGAMSTDDDVDHRNEGRQFCLLAKSLILTYQQGPNFEGQALALREKMNDMPVRYRPKMLHIFALEIRSMERITGLKGADKDGRRCPYSLHVDFQLLLEQSNGLERPVPLRTLSVLAVVMLLDASCADVLETLCRKFDISTVNERECLQAGVVAELILRIPHQTIQIDSLLSRWAVDSMSIRRLLHDALALNRANRREQGWDGLWTFWDTGGLRTERPSAVGEWALGMPEEAIPDFCTLGPMAMRFWELAWAGKTTFRTAQDQFAAIMEMPWQLQPTLVTELMVRFDVRNLSNYAIDIDAWSAKTVGLCFAQGHSVAALRALLVPFLYASSNDEGSEKTMRILKTAYDTALQHIPVRDWIPLIEALATAVSCTYGKREWPDPDDVVKLLETFVRDPACSSFVHLQYVCTGGYFGKIAESIPDRSTATASAFDVFCDRLHIVRNWRPEVLGQIKRKMDEKILNGEIGAEEAARQLAALTTVG